jgi:hypothetical protein
MAEKNVSFHSKISFHLSWQEVKKFQKKNSGNSILKKIDSYLTKGNNLHKSLNLQKEPIRLIRMGSLF